MKEHKCLLCETIYYSREPGYWGYCSDACRRGTVSDHFDAQERRESQQHKEPKNEQ